MDLTQATLGLAFKKAFYQAVKTLMATGYETEHVYVVFGPPTTYNPEDIVSFGRVSSGQAAATMSTNRSREETLTLEVVISCALGGDEDAALATSERSTELLRLIERLVRMDDTTLGGAVRECVLTSYESETEVTDEGMATDIAATFTAKARITA
ncbi:hypothetical protein AU252_19770 [Pseudarthrobacter sulfonivorans]|uniref:Uncharacterized protein n=1 Tax=Pseudarthrobacter sulfonivorans TaxID=121292 RepID=A0A0U3PCA0_9MICC|nr:hypothetical protein [Pseudarthrobacter sulfonivorans]ALV43120.1 hypothetical protein AU252_19770 [Pseudarthrobacter sulfonivorans]